MRDVWGRALGGIPPLANAPMGLAAAEPASWCSGSPMAAAHRVGLAHGLVGVDPVLEQDAGAPAAVGCARSGRMALTCEPSRCRQLWRAVVSGGHEASPVGHRRGQ